jgi:hypothetical protein
MLFHFAQLRNMRLIPVGNITFGQFPAKRVWRRLSAVVLILIHRVDS